MKMTLEIIPTIVSKILDKARNVESQRATVITLRGELGSGKTTLTQALARALHVSESITSPTFVVMKNYELPMTNYEWKKLIHIDAYRLKTSDELWNLGFNELVEDKSNLILIEWPEQVPDCIPQDAYPITLSHVDEHTRTIELGN